ncbi:MAG: PAS domain-containing protein [Halodesulfurarchaeum sp.]|nr:PAS domain-containing protein [Halodesulfurarchaeum sp.]
MDGSADSNLSDHSDSGVIPQSFAPHPYQSLDADGTIISVNDAWLEALGYDREDVIGRWFGDILTDESQSTFASHFDEFKTRGAVSNVEFELIRGEDSPIVVSFDGTIEYDDRGNFVRTHCQFRDITARKEYERTLEERVKELSAIQRATRTLVRIDEPMEAVLREFVEGIPPGFQYPEITAAKLGYRDSEVSTPNFVPTETRLTSRTTTADGKPVTLEVVYLEDRPAADEGPFLTEEGNLLDILVTLASDFIERKTQEHKREQIIERVTDAIVEVDADWRFTVVNEQAEDLYDMAEADLVGRNFWDVFEAARDTRFEEEYRRVMESGEPTSFVEYFSQLDGWFDITAYPTEVGGIAFYFVEVTEQLERQYELEEKNTLLSKLFEMLPVGVTVLDTDGTITRANRQAESALGLTESEITKRTYDDPEWRIIDADGEPIPGEELPFARVLATGETITDYEHGIKWPSGKTRWLSINATPLTTSEGDVEQVVAVISDITDQRTQGNALERQNERLEQFASIVSHDLRNPLTVAEGRLELVREECDSEHLDQIETALDRMTAIIENVLWLAREGRDIGSTEPVEIRDVVESAWDLVADSAEGAELRFVTDESRPSPFHADRDRLSQLLENLLRNAVEHAGDDVTVTVGSLEDGFYVEDDGPGIPESDRTDVFEAGYSTSECGTGFGLGIVKQVAQAHGWDVSITEGETGGARFEFTGVEFGSG